jgi:hypothetical protein
LDLVAYNTKWPNNKAFAPGYIYVNRNPNAPQFLKKDYKKRIPDSFVVGKTILTVFATDKDKVRTFFFMNH